MKVIALRQLKGSYGLASAGDEIEVSNEAGEDLRKRKLVCLPEEYEKKVVAPAEKKTRTRKPKATPNQENGTPDAKGDDSDAGDQGEGDSADDQGDSDTDNEQK